MVYGNTTRLTCVQTVLAALPLQWLMYSPQNPRYLLSGFLQKRFAEPCPGVETVSSYSRGVGTQPSEAAAGLSSGWTDRELGALPVCKTRGFSCMNGGWSKARLSRQDPASASSVLSRGEGAASWSWELRACGWWGRLDWGWKEGGHRGEGPKRGALEIDREPVEQTP